MHLSRFGTSLATRMSALAVSIALLAVATPPASAQTITGGFVTTRESLAGVRFKSLGNTGSKETYLGVPDIGTASHRTERDVTWAATNDATFQYDAINDELLATIVNINGTFNLSYPNLSTQITSFGKTFNVADLDFMQISVYARHVGTTVTFDDFELDAAPLGTFSATYNSVNTWMVSNYAFSAGFTVTGQILLSGTFSGGDEVSKIELTVGKANVCGNGIVELTEQCDDSNTNDGDCCTSACQFDSASTACTSDGNVCTDDVCNGSGTCLHTNNSSPCSDGDACTENDVCSGGTCSADPVCGNGTVEGSCGEECDPPNGITCDASCQSLAVCGNGTLEPGEACDDGNLLAGDCCDAVCQVEVGPCDDADNCTTGDICTPGGCAGTPLDCTFLDSECTTGQCDSLNGECVSVNSNEGGPCDDGNACNANDVCLSGICSACGNASIDAGCGETCDPPISGSCDATCQSVTCGNGIVQTGEECDDGNSKSGDGCSSSCQFEDKLCIEGIRPSVSRQAKKVAFASDYDYVGTNADGNQEIFLFERKKFDKALKKKMKRENLDLATAKAELLASSANLYFFQLTNTVAPVLNDLASLNGSGRVIGFVSSGDLKPGAPGNADGNLEIFRIDYKRNEVQQVTDTTGSVDNLNPNLRAFRGNLVAFDSNGNLAPDRCVGGLDDLAVCANNGDCSSGACGNPEGNREVFVYSYPDAVRGDLAVRQLTAAPTGNSNVGQNANFAERSTAFSSTSNLLGVNPEFNSEIYRVEDTPDSLSPVTVTPAGDNEEAAQATGDRIAFTSNGDLAGTNADGNREIFFWDGLQGPTTFQIGSTIGCFNAGASIDNRGRYVAFHSTCNRILPLGNPDQSIFIWDNRKSTLLPLVVRGENSAASAAPQSTKAVTVLTYESNLGSLVDPAICFLNVKKFLKTLDAQP